MYKNGAAIPEAIAKMNRLGKQKRPFLFVIDFEQKRPLVETLPVHRPDLLFDINGLRELGESVTVPAKPSFRHSAPDFERYRNAFYTVKKHFQNGESYLANLTQPSPIETDLTLLQLFHLAKAPYKLYFKDLFVVFSPESFVRIEAGKIHSYPMKGTIDAGIAHAQRLLLGSEKEKAEHLTMVDLIRNDLSRVAKGVRVEKLCYLDLVKTHKGALWQMSSEISGILPERFHEKIGDILFSMLPAGSVSGAPKKRTVQIIAETENYERGYYTGVFGYFNGYKMDSAVMIRFVEKVDGKLVYKSGGGITAKSELEPEYRELIQKIYVPTD